MRRHRFEPISLVFGLIFAGTGLVALTGDFDVWQLNWSWFWPLALLLGGGAVLLTLRSGSRRGTAEDDDITQP